MASTRGFESAAAAVPANVSVSATTARRPRMRKGYRGRIGEDVRMALAAPTIAVHDGRSLSTARATFNMVAFHWRGPTPVRYRVRFRDGWSPWRAADADAVDHGWHVGNLDWVGPATGLQTRPARGIRAYTVSSPVDGAPPQRRLQLANAPPIISRLS